jgi:hypothetical protein
LICKALNWVFCDGWIKWWDDAWLFVMSVVKFFDSLVGYKVGFSVGRRGAIHAAVVPSV